MNRPGAAALDARAAFLVAHQQLHLLAAAATQRAVAVVAVDSNARVCAALLLHDRDALIVGRHSACGLRLGGDTVSLRHLAVIVRSEEDALQLHVRDLDTNRPFSTEDGVRNRAVVAEGPLYLALASYALWLVPVGPSLELGGSPEDAFAALPFRCFIDRRGPSDDAGVQRKGLVIPHRSGPVTAVTSLAPPLMLADDEGPEVGWGVVRIQHGARRERRTVTAERLESGIILGRADRCGLILNDPHHHISRVHALLLRLGAEVWLIDTASTNGIRRGADEISAAVLRDQDHIRLADGVTLEWRRILHAEA